MSTIFSKTQQILNISKDFFHTSLLKRIFASGEQKRIYFEITQNVKTFITKFVLLISGPKKKKRKKTSKTLLSVCMLFATVVSNRLLKRIWHALNFQICIISHSLWMRWLCFICSLYSNLLGSSPTYILIPPEILSWYSRPVYFHYQPSTYVVYISLIWNVYYYFLIIFYHRFLCFPFNLFTFVLS